VLSMHSSNEPGELSQWFCHGDDTTVGIIRSHRRTTYVDAAYCYRCSVVCRSVIDPPWEGALLRGITSRFSHTLQRTIPSGHDTSAHAVKQHFNWLAAEADSCYIKFSQ